MQVMNELSKTVMEVPRHWRMKNERYNLQGTYDPVTGRYTFGRRPIGEIDAADPGLRRALEQPATASQVDATLTALDRADEAKEHAGLKLQLYGAFGVLGALVIALIGLLVKWLIK